MKIFIVILLLSLSACTTDEIVDDLFDCVLNDCDGDTDYDDSWSGSSDHHDRHRDHNAPCSGEGCGKPRV